MNFLIKILAVDTSILPSCWEMKDLLIFILTFLSYGLGAAAIIGVVIAGIQYLSARDNEQQMAAAKKRLLDVTIGLVAWAIFFGLLNWFIPGGISLNSLSFTSC